MKIGTRSEGHAKCFVGICRALPKKIRYSVREISSLRVPLEYRKSGFAFSLMSKICSEAEKENMIIIVIPKPFGSDAEMSTESLSKWYQNKLGFEILQHKPLMLAKAPLKYLNQFKLKAEAHYE